MSVLLANVFVAPGTELAAPRGSGYIVRYTVERIGGAGPWAEGTSKEAG
ncbi:MAG: hypothetical protein ABSA91_11640 [Acidimicrobiales bacterium]|jgi:hypothetical protein